MACYDLENSLNFDFDIMMWKIVKIMSIIVGLDNSVDFSIH